MAVELTPGSVPESTTHHSALDGDRPGEPPPTAAAPDVPGVVPDRTQDQVERDLGGTTPGGGLSPGAQGVLAVDRTVGQYIDQTYADPSRAREEWLALDQAGRDRLRTDPSVLGPLRQGVRSESVMTGGLVAGSEAVAQTDPADVQEARQQRTSGAPSQGVDRSVADGAGRNRQPTPAEAMNDQLSKALDVRQLTI